MGTIALTTPSGGRPNIVSYSGDLRVIVGTFTFSSSYSTGGEAFDLAGSYGNLVRGTVVFVNFMPTTGGHLLVWDATNKKVKAYWSGTASAVLNEVTAATNLSGQGAIPFIAWVR